MPFEAGRTIAAGIPGARFVLSKVRIISSSGKSRLWETFIEEILTFLESANPALSTAEREAAHSLPDQKGSLGDEAPPPTPPELVELMKRCLERNRDARIRSIGEARSLLSLQPEAPLAHEGADSSSLFWIVIVLGLIAIGIFAYMLASCSSSTVSVRRSRAQGSLGTSRVSSSNQLRTRWSFSVRLYSDRFLTMRNFCPSRETS